MVIALVVINVPYVVHQCQLHRVGSDGIQVTATVVSAQQAGDDVVLALRLPASVDPDQKRAECPGGRDGGCGRGPGG